MLPYSATVEAPEKTAKDRANAPKLTSKVQVLWHVEFDKKNLKIVHCADKTKSQKK